MSEERRILGCWHGIGDCRKIPCPDFDVCYSGERYPPREPDCANCDGEWQSPWCDTVECPPTANRIDEDGGSER